MRPEKYTDKPAAASGVFAQYQPKYAAHGIWTFPVWMGSDKRPHVKGYMTLGPRRSTELAKKFGDSDAFGYVLGSARPQHSNITILDVDTTDDRMLADALSRHGQTPVVVRTASGKAHALYRHNGECRKIRAWPEIDLLGGGYAVAPPSRAGDSAYQFIQGGLDDLDRLPIMRGLEPRLYRGYQQIIPDDWVPLADTDTAPRPVPDGRRHRELLYHALSEARYCQNLDEVLGVAKSFNEESCTPPLPDYEVIGIAQWVWLKTSTGENWKGRRMLSFDADEALQMITTDPDYFVLLSYAKAMNRPGRDFLLHNKLAERLGMSRKRFAATRTRLEQAGEIVMVRKPSTDDGAAHYRFPARTDKKRET